MKLSLYQKIILIVYAGILTFTCILRVPFKISKSKIVYDTLFSDKSNIDLIRLVLIFLFSTIVFGILFFLLRNAKTITIRWLFLERVQKSKGVIAVVGISVMAVVLLVYNFVPISRSESETVQRLDTTSVMIPTIAPSTQHELSQTDLRKIAACTEESSLANFRDYMKFNYPDWKILDKPVVRENGDCTFEIRFTTLNPHLDWNKREVMIARITYNTDYTRYFFLMIRGVIY